LLLVSGVEFAEVPVLSIVKPLLDIKALAIAFLVSSGFPWPTNAAMVIVNRMQQTPPLAAPSTVTETPISGTLLKARTKTLILCASGISHAVALGLQNLTTMVRVTL